MKWKSLFTLLLLSCSSYLMAFGFGFGDCCGDCLDFNGFYAGLAGGVATQMSRDTFDTAADIPGVQNPETLVNNSHLKIYDVEPWGEIFAGWGRQWCNVYWGGRIGGNFSRFEPKVTLKFADLDPLDEGSSFLTDTLKTRLSTAEFSFDFKYGWIFCSKTMLFGIIGGAVNRQELRATSQVNKAAGVTPIAAAFNEVHLSKKKTVVGLRVGFGLEYLVNQCWSLQVNYVYTRYRKFHESGTFTYLSAAGAPFLHRVDFHTQPYKQVASVGLAYYF